MTEIQTSGEAHGIKDSLVVILDDDPVVLKGLNRLLSANGYEVETFDNADDLLDLDPPERPCCVILDHDLGCETTGLDVHAEILRRGWPITVIFLTGHWDVQCVIDAIRNGADDFLTKPVEPEVLVDTVAKAIDSARERLDEFAQAQEIRQRVGQLTAREQEIVRLVANGLLNKEIADKLDIALVTVKVHRGRAMRKLGAGNAAELVRIATLGGLID